MQKPLADPDVADLAPADTLLTRYDEEHVVTYLRMLDADAEVADWREIELIVLHVDPPNAKLRGVAVRSTRTWRGQDG